MRNTKTLYNLFVFLLAGHIENIVCANFGPIRNAIWPYIDSIPFPYPTNDPINITLSQALPVFTPIPLQFINSLPPQQAIIKNTGSTLVLTAPIQSEFTGLSGGVLYNDFYIYIRCEIFWDNSLSGNAGNYVDGRGTSLISVTSYYNKKYGNYDNAKEQRDGIVQVAYSLNVLKGSDNVVFYPFQSVVKKVLKAGSSITFPQLAETYFGLPFCNYYYAYPGEFQDLSSGKVFYSSTVISIVMIPRIWISVRQFNATFGSLENKARKRYSNIAKVFPKGQRPLRVAFGCTNKIFFKIN